MGRRIFTRKAGKLICHNKIQQSGINFIRFCTSGGSNRSTNKIIIISIGKITQLGVFLRHRDKASNLTHEQKNEKMNERREKEKGKSFENHFRSGGEENKRQMAKNVMQEMRVYGGYLVGLM